MSIQFTAFGSLQTALGPNTAGALVQPRHRCSVHPNMLQSLRAVGTVTDVAQRQLAQGGSIVSYYDSAITGLLVQFGIYATQPVAADNLKAGDNIAVFAPNRGCFHCSQGFKATPVMTTTIVSSNDSFVRCTKGIIQPDQLPDLFLVEGPHNMPVRSSSLLRFEHPLAILHNGQELRTRLQRRDGAGNVEFENGLALTEADVHSSTTTFIFIVL